MRIWPLLGPPVLLGLLWTVVAWLPAQSAISSAEDRERSAEGQHASFLAEVERLDEASSQLALIEADLTDASELVPAEPAIDEFLGSLAVVADRAGLRLTLVSPTDVLDGTTDENRAVPSGMEAIAIVIEANGDFSAVMDFTRSLADLSRLVVVDNLTMATPDGASQTVTTTFNLRVFTGQVGTTTDSDATLEPTQ